MEKSQLVAGLTASQKTVPSSYLYDELGSMLFEAITLLPEYEVTRAGLRLLTSHRDEMVARPGPVTLVELGPGAGRKAKLLLEALLERQPNAHFVGVDLSGQALLDCRRTVETLPGVTMASYETDYLSGLKTAAAKRHVGGGSWLVLFLGSNLSNFSRADAQVFLAEVFRQLRPGDSFLLATDLDKDPSLLLPAYADALGVTAAFNKNVLSRLNREHGGNFDLARFTHESRWNAAERRIEMHLVSRKAHSVEIPGLELKLTFRAGESIFTESSHRFRVDELTSWGTAAGFTVEHQWVDEAWPFAQTQFVVPEVLEITKD